MCNASTCLLFDLHNLFLPWKWRYGNTPTIRTVEWWYSSGSGGGGGDYVDDDYDDYDGSDDNHDDDDDCIQHNEPTELP